ncbi:DgyrCDS6820 [Dimorphilus gyrociliatus]|uniref:DgyrCDS6820 n=1 Tax=Dimorphilus gyrociliatus TaxID=2664684 RepID=A0A7I8VP52_9ANNE|nr:DgyrCDS6820 [Dimorphilus gyrociliatus]
MIYKLLTCSYIIYTLYITPINGGCPLKKDCNCLKIEKFYESIDCSKKGLVTVPETTETKITVEKFSLLNNKLKTIPKNYFESFSQIKSLDLDENEFSAIPEAIKVLNVTKTIWIQSNKKLKKLTKGSFTGLISLEEIFLSKNKIATIERGTFDGLMKLETLTLEKNAIVSIGNGLFEGVENSLKYLDLSYNNISKIDDDAFLNLTRVDTLFLEKNKIKRITREQMHSLISIEHINLSDNLIETIDEDAFKSWTKLIYISLWNNKLASVSPSLFSTIAPSLDFISLGSNKNISLDKDFLKNYVRLETLDLSYTKTTSLPTITHLKFLKQVFIIGTKIKTIYECEFEGLNLDKIDLFWDYTPVNCTCDLNWMKKLYTPEKLKNSKLHLESPVCRYPKNLKKSQLVYADLCPRGSSKKWCNYSKPIPSGGKSSKSVISITRVVEMSSSLTIIWEINEDIPIKSFFITSKGKNGNSYHLTKHLPLSDREYKFSKLKAHKYYVVCVVAIDSMNAEISRSCEDTETSDTVVKKLSHNEIGAIVAGILGFLIAALCIGILVYMNRRILHKMFIKTNDTQGIDNIVYDGQRDSVHIGNGVDQPASREANNQHETNRGNMWNYGHLNET